MIMKEMFTFIHQNLKIVKVKLLHDKRAQNCSVRYSKYTAEITRFIIRHITEVGYIV